MRSFGCSGRRKTGLLMLFTGTVLFYLAGALEINYQFSSHYHDF